MANVCVIAGLGNPGDQFKWTRHNVGFVVVERLAGRWNCELRHESPFLARLARTRVFGRDVVLVQPLTYMNASGYAVRAVVEYFGVDRDSTLIVVDDADLPLGRLRLRPDGQSGGHHGLESVITHLGTTRFPRQRIGIGRQPGQRQITEHVLGRFSEAERTVLDRVLDVACDQLECWLQYGIETAMNKYNGFIVPVEKISDEP